MGCPQCKGIGWQFKNGFLVCPVCGLHAWYQPIRPQTDRITAFTAIKMTIKSRLSIEEKLKQITDIIASVKNEQPDKH